MSNESIPVSDERYRNTRAWAHARLDSLSGAAVIVSAIDQMFELRAKLAWYRTYEQLPEKGALVLFELSGAPNVPLIGFFDDKRSFEDRVDSEAETDWDQWWTELRDSDSWWDHKHVTRWCAVPEF